MKPIILNTLYSSGRSYLRPMLWKAMEPYKDRALYDWGQLRENVELLNNLNDNTLVNGHFQLNDWTHYEDLADNKNYYNIFLYRDPRDALVSGMFYNRNSDTTIGRRHRNILAEMSELQAIKYIMREGKKFMRLMDIKINMATASYAISRDNVYSVRYEDMKKNEPEEMKKMLEYLGIPATDIVINKVLKEGSFVHRSGRQPGEEEKRSILRKGISGDWVNYFDEEAKDMFKSIAGDDLIKLGYEINLNW